MDINFKFNYTSTHKMQVFLEEAETLYTKAREHLKNRKQESSWNCAPIFWTEHMFYMLTFLIICLILPPPNTLIFYHKVISAQTSWLSCYTFHHTLQYTLGYTSYKHTLASHINIIKFHQYHAHIDKSIYRGLRKVAEHFFSSVQQPFVSIHINTY